MGALPAPRRLLVGTAMLAVLTVGVLTNLVLTPSPKPRLPMAVELPAATSSLPAGAEPPGRAAGRATGRATHSAPSRKPAPGRISVVAPRPPTTTTTVPPTLTVVPPQRPVVHVDGSSDSSTESPDRSGDGSGG